MNKIDLEAKPRTAAGTGAARRLRRQGMVPSVVYGHGDAIAITVDAKTLERAIKTAGGNLIVALKMQNQDDATTIIRDIQRHPITRNIAHADFQRVSMTEKITTEVHLELTGLSEAVKAGGLLMQMRRSIEVECLLTDIPSNILVDISSLKEFGDSIHASDLKIPAGVELVTEGEVTLVTVQPPVAEEVAPAAVEGVTAAEPEVIAKGKEEKAGAPAAGGEAAKPKK